MTARDRQVLDFCNQVRKALGGRKPRKVILRGVPLDPFRCPVAATIGCGVAATTDFLWIKNDADRWEQATMLPTAVFRFSHDFDNGKLPRWELKS